MKGGSGQAAWRTALQQERLNHPSSMTFPFRGVAHCSGEVPVMSQCLGGCRKGGGGGLQIGRSSTFLVEKPAVIRVTPGAAEACMQSSRQRLGRSFNLKEKDVARFPRKVGGVRNFGSWAGRAGKGQG